MLSKEKRAKEKEHSTKLIWILFIVCVSVFFILGLSIAIKKSISQPKEKPQGMIRIVDEDEPAAGENLSIKQQIAMGKQLVNSSVLDDRIRGMQILMTGNPVEGSRIIIPLLRDESADVRAMAATLLSTYSIPNMGNQIVALLNDPDKKVRQAAGQALLNYSGEQGLMYRLMEPMSSRDPDIVKNAIFVWQQTAPKDPTSAPQALMPALSSLDEAIVTAAVNAIAQAFPRGRDLLPYKTSLEGISSRFGESSAGVVSRSLLEKMKAE